VWVAFLVSTAALIGLVFLSYPAHRPPQETVGFAEFRPPGPAGHPAGLTVRLNLPPGLRAKYAREHPDAEAGVEDARGVRVLYVTTRLVPVGPGADGETALHAFARQNSLTGRADCLDVSGEFRQTARGPVWCQRYTEVFGGHRAAEAPDLGGRPDRLAVLRYAEEWRGLVLELEFYMRVDREGELKPLVWDAVRGMELTDRPGS
jgi:hypothetical protein